MELDTLAAVKMVGRALTSGWLDNFEERKRKAVHDLFDVIENSGDEEMRVKAFAALVRADVADLKRKEVEIRQQEADDAKRLRLLEILQRLPPGELSKLASGDAGDAADGRAHKGQGKEG